MQGAVDLWKALGRERDQEIFGLQRGQVLEGIVCSPTFQKGGTQILKISKRGEEPRKKFWGWGKPKEGKDFQK